MSGSARMKARRKAAEIKRARMEAVLLREAEIEVAVAGFFENRLTADKVRQTAAERAARIVAAGERKAMSFVGASADAVVALANLGQTRGQIAQLCDVGLPEVRAVLAAEQSRVGGHPVSAAR